MTWGRARVTNRAGNRADVMQEEQATHLRALALVPLPQDVRSSILSWLGILGGSLTLFDHLKQVLTLSEWAALLMQKWSAWTHAVWSTVFGWLSIDLPPQWSPVLTFMAFLTAAILGTLRAIHLGRKAGVSDELPSLSWQTIVDNKYPLAVGGLLAAVALGLIIDWRVGIPTGPVMVAALLMVVLAARDKLAVALCVTLFAICFFALVPVPLSALYGGRIGVFFNPVSEALMSALRATFIAMLISVPILVAALFFMPARRLNTKFIFMLVGLAILLGLNAIAETGLPEKMGETPVEAKP